MLQQPERHNRPRGNPTRRTILSMALGAILACSAACTNFSAESQVINPPILFSVAAEDTGHIISLSAQNTELGFAG